MGGVNQAKQEYFNKLRNLLETYGTIFIVGVDNVSSNQMHQVRKALRGKAVILMGKNTLIRRALRTFVDEFPECEKLLPLVRGNCGFAFTNDDLKTVRDIITANVVAAPARAGAYAPKDVFVPAGNTGMEPGKTSFFQALGVPTKIARGTIEITSEVHLIHKDARVGPSEASLLNLLNISPFTYGLIVQDIFQNGQIFKPTILDISEEDLLKHFTAAVATIASISLAANYPTIVSVNHSIMNAYKNLLGVSVATDYTFDGSAKIKEMLANPEAFAAAAAPAAADSGSAPAAKEEAKEEEESGSDSDMGMGLFD